MSGVVAAGHELTARAAEIILREGGNAFDAALGALAAACVVEPVLASLGGGAFLLAQPADGSARVYDCFVQTPIRRRAVSETDFRPIIADFGSAEQEFHVGNGSIATPGVVRGLFAVHRDLGRMPLPELMQPALQYAAEGVIVNNFQAYIFSIISAIYTTSSSAMAIYGKSGRLPREGDTLRQPELADTLETLAIEGERLFYQGEIARAIVTDQQSGGHLGATDLSCYPVEVRRPLELTDYRQAGITTNPPPASGGLLIAFGLRLLESYAGACPAFGSKGHLQRLIRVFELTEEARLQIQARLPEQDGQGLLHSGLVAEYRDRIAGQPPARRGTTHISVMDGEGNVAALSTSNGEGSGYMVPGTGIMLNNMLGEADLNTGGFHQWAENTRMTSMMAPSIIRFPDGRLATLGSGGSNRIRTAMLQVIFNLLDFGMGVDEAVNAPRIHLEQGVLSIEGGFDTRVIEALSDSCRQQDVWDSINLFFGGVHTVLNDGNRFYGAGDPRRGGVCRIVGQ